MTNPDYKLVCTGATDHAEALRIEFDPTLVKYDELVGRFTTTFRIQEQIDDSRRVEFFYRTHDPTTVDRQGPDQGTRM